MSGVATDGVVVAAEGEQVPAGASPWALARRRLRRNKIAMVMAGVLAIIVVACLAAPLYARDIAHTSPFQSNLDGTTIVSGKRVLVMPPSTTGLGLGSVPIGPTWDPRHYLLGADDQGRDVAARLLYGGRNSLLIGTAAALITCFFATMIGIVAGYFGGLLDGVLSRLLDVVWAFPVYLLAISLSTVLLTRSFSLGPFKLQSGSLLLPILIIGVVYIPYVGKPIRAQVVALREREFIDAARQQGLGPVRIMVGEILPNLASTIIVFFPLILANSILLEAGLSYLGAGVQAPAPSWGTMISDGIHLIPAAIHLTLVPGIMLVLAVLGINVFGDGVRDALDPRSQVRVGR